MRQQVAEASKVLRWLHEYRRASHRDKANEIPKYFAQESYVQEQVNSDGIRRHSWLDVRDDKAATTLSYDWPQVYTSLPGSGSDTIRLQYCQDWARLQPGKPAPRVYGMVTLTLEPDPDMGFVVQKERISERPAWGNCRLGMASEWRLSSPAESAIWMLEPCEPKTDPHCKHFGAFLLVGSRTETQVIYLDLDTITEPEFEKEEGRVLVGFGHLSSTGQLRFRREGQSLQLEVRWFDYDQLPTGAYYAGPRIDLRTSQPIPLLCQPQGEDGSLSDDSLAPCTSAALTL